MTSNEFVDLITVALAHARKCVTRSNWDLVAMHWDRWEVAAAMNGGPDVDYRASTPRQAARRLILAVANLDRREG